jgi:hypothetical protein
VSYYVDDEGIRIHVRGFHSARSVHSTAYHREDVQIIDDLNAHVDIGDISNWLTWDKVNVCFGDFPLRLFPHKAN